MSESFNPFAPNPLPLVPIANAEQQIALCPVCHTALAADSEQCPVCALAAEESEETDPDDPDMDGLASLDSDGSPLIPTQYAPGGTVKSLPDNPYHLKTKGIVYGGSDLVGDTFTKQTDIGKARSFVGMPVYYDHALRGIKSQIGVVTDANEDDTGIEFDIELDRNHRYVKEVLALNAADAMGSSSGAPGHLVRRKGGVLKRWIVSELSLTPTPAESRTLPIFAVKAIDPSSQEENTIMADEATQTITPNADTTALRGEVAALRQELSDLKSMPAVKTAQELGGTIGGGMQARAVEAQPAQTWHNFKSLSLPGGRAQFTERYPAASFGGFVKAVLDAKSSVQRSGDARKVLADVYGVTEDDTAAKALGTQSGVTGAYLIPEQFIPSLMAVAQQKDALYGRAMVIPADGGEIVVPALDHSGTYAEGQSQYYGGVTITWGDDDAAATDTTPRLKQIRLKTNSLKAKVRIKNSLLQRSAVTIDAVVTTLLGGAIGWARDYAMIRGSGIGRPLGALNAPACIDAAGTALDYATLTAMEARTIPERDENYVWLIHTLRRNDVMALQQTNNTLVTFLPDLRGKPSTSLLGRPVVYTDKLPYTSGAANAADSVLLIDPTMIVCAEYQGIAIAVSDQVRFEDDETVFRVILSMDSQPWLTSAIAIGSGASDTVSGYIKL